MAVIELCYKGKTGEVRAARNDTIGSPNARQSMQDRSDVRITKTKMGQEILLGLVADGMGGLKDGEIAAEKTKEAILRVVENNQEQDLSMLLKRAIEAANDDVMTFLRGLSTQETTGSTATVVAIHDGKLYLAHVGDSRAYLLREGLLFQLTEDHTWLNLMVKSGKLSPEEVKRLSDKNYLERHVGKDPTIQVDTTINHPDAQGKNYLELKPGDAILICSDGLIKERPGGSTVQFVTNEEIIDVFEKEPPVGIVNTLLGIAKGRQVDDNVSVIAMQMEGKKRVMHLPKVNIDVRAVSAIIIIGILILLVLVVIIPSLTPQPPESQATKSVPTFTMPAAVAIGSAKVIEASTAQIQVGTGNPTSLQKGAVVSGGSTKITSLGGKVILALSDGGLIYINDHASVILNSLVDASAGITSTQITLEGGRVYVSGKGAIFQVMAAGQPSWSAEVRGSKMGVDYNKIDTFVVDCFEGNCLVSGDGQVLNVSAGQGGGIERNTMGTERPANFEIWLALAGLDVPVPPTLTPTPTLPATATPSPTPITPTPKPVIVLPSPIPTETPGNPSHGGPTKCPPEACG